MLRKIFGHIHNFNCSFFYASRQYPWAENHPLFRKILMKNHASSKPCHRSQHLLNREVRHARTMLALPFETG
jgi:hypothetical protein